MAIISKPITIDDIFTNKKYYIDFYQREYKWTKNQVERLLDDIFYKFENEYTKEIDINIESISDFSWYYLSSYMTNTYNGKIYIVDGQQRFSTLTLILIKLYHLSKFYKLSNRTEWLKSKIYGVGVEGKSYWMGDNNRSEPLEILYHEDDKISNLANPNNLSINNMYDNYIYIGEYLTKKIDSEHKFEAIVLYILKRLYLVNIEIEDYKDVSMVFEVINDRGERLKPYEVFKGQLLGQLDKSEINQYNTIWTENISKLQSLDEKEVDNFFRFYFRAKYTDTRADSKEFDGEYNKTIFSTKWNERLHLKNNSVMVKKFIKEDFSYYCDLYYRMLTDYAKNENSHVFYNSMNNQDRQYLLVLSSINKDEENLKGKIEFVARMFDKYFTLLQLLGCYDSNNFTESIIHLNTNIRNKNMEEIENIFNVQLINDIKVTKSINIENPFQWTLFKEASNSLGVTFLRYFFTRIDNFIANQLDLNQYDKSYNLIRNTGSVNGYHIEHILADNDENKHIFNNDEELFYTQRNYLGSLLLMKGKDNQSSGNEKYSEKLKTYAHGNIWAETLTTNYYHHNKNFNDFIHKYNLNFRAINNFDQDAIEERQRLLFQLVKVIWA
ncbi:DUF262 domain-containing protein [Clostridium estertheticum]|uniref:DUF262 domain-containing protein n=1 Tax=Clostridium estertheticum TaxID=238834 RepID=UPI001C0BB37D|nr:DUF262 domain-containing protein [Clostridium estertheticum]MBU3172761.1 DUF262 domain-containing HNH endonuclease family protein [Clostridium estertheticum]